MSEVSISIPVDSLRKYITALFSAAGLPEEHATFHAQALIQTNLWGIDSHGVLRVPIYIKRIQSGAVNANPDIRKLRGGLAIEVWDGDDGAGFIVARRIMQRAIELAEQYGIGAVGAIRSNHFGATGLYARMAAERNLIGIAMTNVVPNIVAPGGSKPITGNNPIAFAVPTFQDFPLVLDMSMSSVAGGKLLLASKEGHKIPLDWATDDQGRPTDDPDIGFKGFLLPMAGYKGLGLSYVIDILSGLMTGGAFQYDMKGMYKYPDDPSQTGHFVIVINPQDLIDLDELRQRMTQFYQTIKSAPMWDDSREMMLPGEVEYRTEQTRLETGIPISENLLEELRELGTQLGISETI